MAISKSKREAVYRKHNGHCAYCGRKISYKDMQVDHFQPLRAWGLRTLEQMTLTTSCQPAGCAIITREQIRSKHSAAISQTFRESSARIISTRSAWFMAMSSRQKNRLRFTLRRRKEEGLTMAEYIDKEEYCEKHCRCSNEHCDRQSCPIWKAPAADAVPAVRCGRLRVLPQRASRAMDRAADATGRVLEALRRYDELIAPYEGMRWTDVPADIRCRAVALLTEAQSAEVERRKRSVGMPRKPERGRGNGAR